MTHLLETSFLTPNLVFMIETVFVLGVLGVLVIWPLVRAATDERWGWAVLIILTGPIGGLLWFVLGRRSRDTAPAAR